MNILAKKVAACVVALGLGVAASAGLAATSQDSGKLGRRAEQLVIEAQQAGRSRIVVLVAVRPGNANQAVASITGLGGRIEYRDDTLGYLRANVPVDQVRAVAALTSVQAVDVDEIVPLPDPRPEG